MTGIALSGYNRGMVGKPHVSLRFSMKDDEQYQRVMTAYKIARRDPKKMREARKLLAEANRLERDGEVSPEVVEGMAYI